MKRHGPRYYESLEIVAEIQANAARLNRAYLPLSTGDRAGPARESLPIETADAVRSLRTLAHRYLQVNVPGYRAHGGDLPPGAPTALSCRRAADRLNEQAFALGRIDRGPVVVDRHRPRWSRLWGRGEILERMYDVAFNAGVLDQCYERRFGPPERPSYAPYRPARPMPQDFTGLGRRRPR